MTSWAVFSRAPSGLRRVATPRALYVVVTLVYATFVISTIPGVRPHPGYNLLLDGILNNIAYELSAVVCFVRARNALRKMNIRTLADLLKVTEAELRNFKNFGEASLEEIKTMLAQRGLRMGQAVEQQQSAAKRAVYDQLKTETGSNDEVLNRPVADLNLSVRAEP